MTRLYIPVYATTLILSAFLLFSVQPLFGKMILPTLGGSSSVWNTSMLFFQAVLLMGYAYAHGTTKLFSVRTQSIIHIVLLIVCCIFLPLGLSLSWPEPDTTKNLIGWQLGLMAVSIGAPFFVLSGSAPMFQRWFSKTDHKDADNPYFLYGASNLGSMTALLTYPFLIEPVFTLGQQSMIWSGGYIALIILTILCSGFVFKNAGKKNDVDIDETQKNKTASITNKDRLSWLFLAFVPSSLMLGVTTYITRDIASLPLLWIVPLALYVGTFIVAFARKQIVTEKTLLYAQLLLFIAYILFAGQLSSKMPFLYLSIHLALFTVTAQYCHSRLSTLKPDASKLTEFFLILSFGGVLGGLFNAIIAPLLFTYPIEYVLVLVVSALARNYGEAEQSFKSLFKRKDYNFLLSCLLIGVFCSFVVFFADLLVVTAGQSEGRSLFYIIKMVALYFMIIALYGSSYSRITFFALLSCALILLPYKKWHKLERHAYAERNYFGLSLVEVYKQNDLRYHQYTHGITVHGVQLQKDELKTIPLSYYYKPVNDIFALLDEKQGPQKVAAIGLGVGSISCYQRPDRHFTFYEIDPVVKKIAENEDYFSYLSDCAGENYDIILGDARLSLQDAEDNSYDMIFLDAFSSDSIPIHLLTVEAFKLYLQKLKPDGVIVPHISNRYLDLVPVINAAAKELGLTAMFKDTESAEIDEAEFKYNGSYYSIVARDMSVVKPLNTQKGWVQRQYSLDRAWTDDYANIFSVIIFGSRRYSDMAETKTPSIEKDSQKTEEE